MHSKSIRAKTGHVAVALLIALCQMALAQGDADLAAPGLEPFPTTSIGSPTLFQKRPYLRRPERRALRSLQRAGAWQHHRAHLIGSHPLTRTSPSSQPTAHVEAGPHRRALARHHGVAAPNRPDDRRPLLPATTSCPRERATLMRGFTTVRDPGGPVFGLKRATDEGVVLGLRIYPSGAFIFANLRTWRLPLLLRSPAHAGRPAQPLRDCGRCSHC